MLGSSCGGGESATPTGGRQAANVESLTGFFTEPGAGAMASKTCIMGLRRSPKYAAFRRLTELAAGGVSRAETRAAYHDKLGIGPKLR